MPILVSLKTVANPSLNMVNRLCSGARIALAADRKNGLARAVEILETAPEQKWISSIFHPVYQMLVPLYLEHDIFESSLISPDFSRADVDMFNLAFQSFRGQEDSAEELRVNFYLGVIALAFGEEEKALDHFSRAQKTGLLWGTEVPAVISALTNWQVDQARARLGEKFGRLESAARRSILPEPGWDEFAHALAWRKNKLFRKWLKGEIAAPTHWFSATPARSKGLSFYFYHQQLRCSIEPGTGKQVMLRLRDKRGKKIVDIFSAGGIRLLGKLEISGHQAEAMKLTKYLPELSLLTRERNQLIIRWLKNKIPAPEEYYIYQFGREPRVPLGFGTGLVTLYLPIQSVEKEEIAGLEQYFCPSQNVYAHYHFRPGLSSQTIIATGDQRLIKLWELTHQVAVRFEDREEENGEIQKIAAVYDLRDLDNPIAEYRLQKTAAGKYQASALNPFNRQDALQRSKTAADWLRDKITDPERTFSFYVTKNGHVYLSKIAGKYIDLGSLSDFYLGKRFTKQEIGDLKAWFEELPGEPGQFVMKPGTDSFAVKRARDKRLYELWRRARQVEVVFKTIGKEKIVTVSQSKNPRPARQFRLKLLADGSLVVEAVNLSKHQEMLQRMRPIRQYLLGKGPRPTVPIVLPLQSNGSVTIGVGGRRLTLCGLKACMYFDPKKIEDLTEKQKGYFSTREGKACFRRELRIKDVRAAGDPELTALWEESHRVSVTFREEKTSGAVRIIIQGRHVATGELVAEYEVMTKKSAAPRRPTRSQAQINTLTRKLLTTLLAPVPRGFNLPGYRIVEELKITRRKLVALLDKEIDSDPELLGRLKRLIERLEKDKIKSNG